MKDGINDFVVARRRERRQSRTQIGTKAAAHYALTSRRGRARSSGCGCNAATASTTSPTRSATSIETVRDAQARGRRVLQPPITPAALSADAASVMRQALAGMLWSKQFYVYDVDRG